MNNYQEYRDKMDELISLLLSLQTQEGKDAVNSYTTEQHIELLTKIQDVTKFILKQAEEEPGFDPDGSMKARCSKILLTVYAKIKEYESKR